MSGYRESSFDPNAGAGRGAPLRPYNWVQWTGVGFLWAGGAVLLVYFAGRIGLIPKLLDSPTLATALVLVSIPLVNSRRGPLSPRTRRQRILIIAVAALVCVAAAALVILDLKGA